MSLCPTFPLYTINQKKDMSRKVLHVLIGCFPILLLFSCSATTISKVDTKLVKCMLYRFHWRFYVQVKLVTWPSWLLDENHKAFKDPLHVPVGSITKARSKKIKEALNGLIQEILADSNTGHSKLDPKENEGIINLIQVIEGWSALIGRDLWRGLMADWLSNPILVNSHFSYS